VDTADIRTARRQALASVVLLVAIGGAVIAAQKRPADADELKIPIAMLRSHAGELLVLAQNKDSTPASFSRAHRRQLSRAIDSANEDLDKLKLQSATLETLRREVRPYGAELAKAADPDTHDAPIPLSSQSLLMWQERLKKTESRLER
jgi:hypothetical protein